ncbi:hypothetical protein F4677DRAFT_124010 [Hypoxylon crocopeplum]|nr:hypothetical protein F4677DRAFT_124010 [Hypoxylon crocopeplum]
MGAYNFRLLKDELSLPAWLAIGAAAQIIVSFAAPARFAYVPAVVTIAVLTLNFAAQLFGLTQNIYLKNTVPGRHTVIFPNDDGTRPENFGDKPIAMFLVGIRSNSPLGRLSPAYRKLNDYMDELYADAEGNRTTNGYLGRTADFLPQDFSSNNTLLSISYWKTIEDLEAFARRPIHIKAFRYLVKIQTTGNDQQGTGVLHEILYCPPGHWEAIYSNMNPWGLQRLQWPMPKSRALQGPFVEHNMKIINGMWGRMGNKLKQTESDEKMAQAEKAAAAYLTGAPTTAV